MTIKSKLYGSYGYPFNESELKEAINFFKAKPILKFFKYIDGMSILSYPDNPNIIYGGFLGGLFNSKSFSIYDFKEELCLSQNIEDLEEGLSYLNESGRWGDEKTLRVLCKWYNHHY